MLSYKVQWPFTVLEYLWGSIEIAKTETGGLLCQTLLQGFTFTSANFIPKKRQACGTMAPKAGILYVTISPHNVPNLANFHDWYNNEHCPARLKLPRVFHNGFRYHAGGKLPDSPESPAWMAVYDVSDTALMEQDIYTHLRRPPAQSEREREIMKNISIERKIFNSEFEKVAQDFPRFEEVHYEGTKENQNMIVSILFTLKSPDLGSELKKWHEEEHIQLVAKIPGWRRSRLFSSVDSQKQYLALHDFAPENGLGHSEEFKASINTPWRTKIMEKVVADTPKSRFYNLYSIIGPAARDLASLTDSSVKEFQSVDGLLRTIPALAPNAAIEDVVTTQDGVQLPYRLQGSSDPNAPLMVLVNSILTTYGIWDGFIAKFFADERNHSFRIVQFNARGRSTLPDSAKKPVTVDELAADVIALLDALRVPKAALVMGVSLGGATALTTALRFPERVARLVACDTNSRAPPTNEKAWKDRIAVAEKEGVAIMQLHRRERLGARVGEKVVGSDLAKETVQRWFAETSQADAQTGREVVLVKDMVATNSLEGFKSAVHALFDYDLTEDMKSARVPALFVVGGSDGVLPKTMKDMAAGYGDGSAKLEVIDGARHLPMVEQPDRFAEVVTAFLAS